MGPLNNMTTLHMDGRSLAVGVQAVQKHGGSHTFLMVHLVNPRSGRHDFKEWIMREAQQRQAAAAAMLARRDGRESGMIPVNAAAIMRLPLPDPSDPATRQGTAAGKVAMGGFDALPDGGAGMWPLTPVLYGGAPGTAPPDKGRAGGTAGMPSIPASMRAATAPAQNLLAGQGLGMTVAPRAIITRGMSRQGTKGMEDEHGLVRTTAGDSGRPGAPVPAVPMLDLKGIARNRTSTLEALPEEPSAHSLEVPDRRNSQDSDHVIRAVKAMQALKSGQPLDEEQLATARGVNLELATTPREQPSKRASVTFGSAGGPDPNQPSAADLNIVVQRGLQTSNPGEPDKEVADLTLSRTAAWVLSNGTTHGFAPEALEGTPVEPLGSPIAGGQAGEKQAWGGADATPLSPTYSSPLSPRLARKETMDSEADAPPPLSPPGSDSGSDSSDAPVGGDRHDDGKSSERLGSQGKKRHGQAKSRKGDNGEDANSIMSGMGDEAGADYADFRRGKRFRKLSKMLGGQQVRATMAPCPDSFQSFMVHVA